jgi:hypothetical protein
VKLTIVRVGMLIGIGQPLTSLSASPYL